MNQPFLQAYQELLVHTCLKHKVRAISSSLQQFRRRTLDEDEREQARVSLEIQHEIELGFDGICIADADLVPVALSTFKENTEEARAIGPDVGQCHITARDLISPSLGRITMTALKENVESALVYLEGWLAGQGSAHSASGIEEYGFGGVVPGSALAMDSPFCSAYVRAPGQPICGRMPHP